MNDINKNIVTEIIIDVDKFNQLQKVEDSEIILKNEKLEKVLINPLIDLMPPQICIEVFDNENESSILGTLGDFSLIIGKAKSKKSFFISIAVSAATKNNLVLDKIKGKLPSNQNQVLYFDTEQSEYYVQRAVQRICKITEIKNPENLKTYYLRKFSPKERLELIEHAIYNNSNIGLVVIDGIKDLVFSINDESEATNISSKLLKWTEENNIHIICVLHQNKSDNNARGHLGTELINKAESVVSITKAPENENISIVEAEFCRNKDFTTFAFEIDDLGIPKITEYHAKKEHDKKKFQISNYSDIELFKVVNCIFLKNQSPKYSELVFITKQTVESELKVSIGDNKAKELITYFNSKSWCIQSSAKSPYSKGEFKS
jgi:hypothetical protein